MADSSLDDFFAKKDKSKKKAKSKLTPSDILSKEQIDGRAKKEKKKKEKEKKEREKNQTLSPTTPSDVKSDEEDEEWKDFEEEREKDYSGLRIQNLQIKREEEEEKEDQLEEEDGEEGENKERRDISQGPWNKSGATPVPAAMMSQAAPELPSEPAVEETPKTAGKYIPPSMRGLGSTPTVSAAAAARKKKEAPNLRSEEDFPTLGGMRDAFDSGQDFQQEGEISHPSQRKGLQLSLENKYSALQD